MKEYKLFVQRIGLFGITNMLVSLSPLILLPFLTKNLTTQDYAVWGVFITTVGFIPMLVNLGLPYSMVRFLAVKRSKEEIKEEFYSITFLLLFVGLITSLILFLFSKQISALFNGNTIISTLLAVSVLVGMAYTAFSAFFITFQQTKIVSILSLIQTYLMVALVSFLLESGYKVEGAIFGYFIVQFIACLAAIWLVLRQIGFKFPKFKNVREYLSFGVPTIPGNLSSWMVDMSDRYLILFILGLTFVGYYNPAYSLGIIILMFAAPFNFILPSLMSMYYDQNKIEEVEKHLEYSVKYFMLIAIPAVFGLSLLSKPLLTVLTRPEIAQNGYLITPFIASGALILGLYGITSNVLALEKKTKIIGSWWMAAAVLNIGLNIIFIPRFGIIAAAIATLIAYLFIFVTILRYSQKYIKIRFDFKFIAKSLIASILMSAAIIFINPASKLEILITILISSVVYITVIFILGGISRDETEFFKQLAYRE